MNSMVSSSLGGFLGGALESRIFSETVKTPAHLIIGQKCKSKKVSVVRTASALAPSTSADELSSTPVLFQSFGPDMFVLDLAEALQEQEKSSSLGSNKKILDQFGEESAGAALSMKWPTEKDEAFRFTNLRQLRSCSINPSSATEEQPVDNIQSLLESLTLSEAAGCRLVFVDGTFDSHLSSTENIPQEIVACSLGALPESLAQKIVVPFLGKSLSSASGATLFSSLNAIGAPDLGVIYVPKGVKAAKPVHVIYISRGNTSQEDPIEVSSPRLLVVAEEDSEVQFVEEFVGSAEGYWTNSVTEIFLGKRAKVNHGYIQSQTKQAFHTKTTAISQEDSSHYLMVEGELGSRLARHTLLVQQKGPDTVTEVSTFTLSGESQLQDLHSSLVLDHPRGQTRQLHKCIVTHSKGQAVFDGNVKVNRLAQQTDAGQLSRSLLLAPRGTVNVKPNLQIVADDVKCTHGAAISDLEDDQLFYFLARGIDEQAARSALVFSFAAEVIEKLQFSDLRKRIESAVKGTLLAEGAMDSAVASGLGMQDSL